MVNKSLKSLESLSPKLKRFKKFTKIFTEAFALVNGVIFA